MSEYERHNPGLAYEPAGQDFESAPESGSEKNPENIEREIEETRARMSQNIDELGDRLSPSNLKQEAKMPSVTRRRTPSPTSANRPGGPAHGWWTSSGKTPCRLSRSAPG